jgi:hypothetical protein
VSESELTRINGQLIGGAEWERLIAAADKVVTI